MKTNHEGVGNLLILLKCYIILMFVCWLLSMLQISLTAAELPSLESADDSSRADNLILMDSARIIEEYGSMELYLKAKEGYLEFQAIKKFRPRLEDALAFDAYLLESARKVRKYQSDFQRLVTQLDDELEMTRAIVFVYQAYLSIVAIDNYRLLYSSWAFGGEPVCDGLTYNVNLLDTTRARLDNILPQCVNALLTVKGNEMSGLFVQVLDSMRGSYPSKRCDPSFQILNSLIKSQLSKPK
ncbi:MAG: hypothetical protein HRF51_05055 [bacterium]